jgi:hypothetical protein
MMFKKLQVVAVVMCMLSYAAAGTVSIGTVSARGDMRVDSYMVKGNATLFEGSVVETGQATADLRLDKGTEITMATSSRGTLYRDHLVLQQGESEMVASSAFQVEANGLRVTSSEPNSRGVVAMKPGNTVEVAALNGSFGVTNDHGILLASVRPGRAVSFAMKAAPDLQSFSGEGIISVENGHYFLTTHENVKYEVTGKDLKKYEGKGVYIEGPLVPGATPAQGATAVISLSHISILGAAGMSLTSMLVVGGVIIGGGAAVGFAVSQANNNPASR